MSKLSLKVLLGVVALMFSASESYSFPIECTDVNPTPLYSTFVSHQAAESWLPQKIILRKSSIDYKGVKRNRSSTANNWTFFHSKRQIKAKYIPHDRKLRVQFTSGGAYKMHAPVYYNKCVSKARSAKKTTPVNDVPKASIEYPLLRRAFSERSFSDRKEIQRILSTLGFYKSSIDGQYGRGTERALLAYKLRNDKYLPKRKRLTDTDYVLALLDHILPIEVVEFEEASANKPSKTITSWSDDTFQLKNYYQELDFKSRKKIQAKLAKLLYYSKYDGIDGLWREELEKGLIQYARANALMSASPDKLIASLNVKVEKTAGFCTSDTVSQCSDEELCSWASSKGNWSLNKTLRPYVNQAQLRGLDCGVAGKDIPKQTAAVEQPEPEPSPKLDIAQVKASYDAKDYTKAFADARLLAVQGDPEAQLLLGKMFADGRGTLQVSTVAHMWFNIASMGGIDEAYEQRKAIAAQMTPAAVEEAQKMAMKCIQSNYADCGLAVKPVAVKQPKPVQKTYITSGSQVEAWFKDETRLKRKQLQYALKKLGVYGSSVDGLWGGNTSRAFTFYINRDKRDAETVKELFVSILNKVNVPSSFSTSKKSYSSSSSSKKPSFYVPSGWRLVTNNPQHSFEQANAICKPMSENAGASAKSYKQKSNSFNCRGNSYSFNCSENSGGFAEGFAESFVTGLNRKRARQRAFASCMAQYGWVEK